MFISQWTTWVDAVFVHISHEINNQQCLGKYGLSFIYLFFGFIYLFWILRVYLPFLHRPITAMGDIFQWVVRFQPCRYFSNIYFFAALGRCEKFVLNLKCWQLNPKIYLKDFIDFWFNCVRLLNHVKVTLNKPFTREMKSVVSNLIGPMPFLCQCPPFAVWLLQGSNSVWLEWAAWLPRIMVGCKNTNKQTRRKFKINSQSIDHYIAAV